MSCMLSIAELVWEVVIILLKITGDSAAPSTDWSHTCRTAIWQTECPNVGALCLLSDRVCLCCSHHPVLPCWSWNSLQQAAQKTWSHCRGLFLRKLPALQIPYETRVERASTYHLDHHHPSFVECRLHPCASSSMVLESYL